MAILLLETEVKDIFATTETTILGIGKPMLYQINYSGYTGKEVKKKTSAKENLFQLFEELVLFTNRATDYIQRCNTTHCCGSKCL